MSEQVTQADLARLAASVVRRIAAAYTCSDFARALSDTVRHCEKEAERLAIQEEAQQTCAQAFPDAYEWVHFDCGKTVMLDRDSAGLVKALRAERDDLAAQRDRLMEQGEDGYQMFHKARMQGAEAAWKLSELVSHLRKQISQRLLIDCREVKATIDKYAPPTAF
jgi:hypothetical protein